MIHSGVCVCVSVCVCVCVCVCRGCIHTSVSEKGAHRTSVADLKDLLA